MARKFIVCRDFYVSGGKILMSLEGIDKINETKIDSDKFAHVFQMPKEKQSTQDTEYNAWSKIIGFMEERESVLDKKRELLQCNRGIISYLKKQLNQDWQTYSEYKINVFPGGDWFGGVPCGESWTGQQSDNCTSILEIVYKQQDMKEKQIMANFLKLSLYLSLRNLNSGWICICITPFKTRELAKGIKIDHDLEKISIQSVSKTVNVVSSIPDIGACPFSFTILEEWKSRGSSEENKIHLIKVAVDLQKVEMIKGKIRTWFTKYRSESPKISVDRMQHILAANGW